MPRGRTKGSAANEANMTFEQISLILGCSETSVRRTYKTALRKLRAEPGLYAGLIKTIHAVDGELLTAGSAECDKEFKMFYTSQSEKERIIK